MKFSKNLLKLIRFDADAGILNVDVAIPALLKTGQVDLAFVRVSNRIRNKVLYDLAE